VRSAKSLFQGGFDFREGVFAKACTDTLLLHRFQDKGLNGLLHSGVGNVWF
jgi:hypothetical protein